jgi:hypothetical protein
MPSILLSCERRLASVADQAHETREQAQHTLDRVNLLRRDLGQFRQHLSSRRQADGAADGQPRAAP